MTPLVSPEILGNTFASHGQPPATSSSFATTSLKSLRAPRNSRIIPGSANCEIGNNGVRVSEHCSGRSGIEEWLKPRNSGVHSYFCHSETCCTGCDTAGWPQIRGLRSQTLPYPRPPPTTKDFGQTVHIKMAAGRPLEPLSPVSPSCALKIASRVRLRTHFVERFSWSPVRWESSSGMQPVCITVGKAKRTHTDHSLSVTTRFQTRLAHLPPYAVATASLIITQSTPAWHPVSHSTTALSWLVSITITPATTRMCILVRKLTS